jgi:hypothetical protein
MQHDKLEALLESLNIEESKAAQIRTVLKEMLSHTKKDTAKLKTDDAKLLIMAKMVEEKDWKQRASLAAALISLDL